MEEGKGQKATYIAVFATHFLNLWSFLDELWSRIEKKKNSGDDQQKFSIKTICQQTIVCSVDVYAWSKAVPPISKKWASAFPGKFKIGSSLISY